MKSSFHSQDIQFFIKNFLFLSRYSRLKGLDETGTIMTSLIGMHKLANVIFGITQKPLCIKSLKLLR